MSVSNVTKKIVSDLRLSENVVTDIDCSSIRAIHIPYIDFLINETFSGLTVTIEAENFTTNNIITTADELYGKLPPSSYDINIFIPEHPDESAKFNEFYLNFVVLDGLSLNVKFFLMDDAHTEITDLRKTITKDMTYHFYENINDEYTVNFGDNLVGNISH